MLEKEFTYYQTHREELLEKYEGRFIVIKDESILSDHATREAAIVETQKAHKMGSFLVQLVSRDPENEVMRFHSRVSFTSHAK